MTTEPLVYLYGFVREVGAVPEPDLEGVGGAPVALVSLGEIAAVISRVPAEQYDEAGVTERITDLRWAAEQGVRHERVVAWFVDRGTILPARLLTLYRSLESLRDAVALRASDLRAELERLAGLREWELKVAYDPARFGDRLGELSDAVRELDAELSAAAPGRRYLLEKKRAEQVRSEAGRAAARLADETLELAAAHVREAKRLPLASPTAALARDMAEGGLPVVLSAALLVAEEAEADLVQGLRERAAEVEPLGMEIRFSGPWAPYRFVATELGEESRATDA